MLQWNGSVLSHRLKRSLSHSLTLTCLLAMLSDAVQLCLTNANFCDNRQRKIGIFQWTTSQAQLDGAHTPHIRIPKRKRCAHRFSHLIWFVQFNWKRIFHFFSRFLIICLRFWFNHLHRWIKTLIDSYQSDWIGWNCKKCVVNIQSNLTQPHQFKSNKVSVSREYSQNFW